MIDKPGPGREAASAERISGGKESRRRARGRRSVPFVEMVTSLLVHCAVVVAIVGGGAVVVRKVADRNTITVSLHGAGREFHDSLPSLKNVSPALVDSERIQRDGGEAASTRNTVGDGPEFQLAEFVDREMSADTPLLREDDTSLTGLNDSVTESSHGEGGQVADTAAAKAPFPQAADTAAGKALRFHAAVFGAPDGPRFLKRVDPIYPLVARRLGKEGRVVLSLTIDARGGLVSVEVLEKADFGFDHSAVEAVRASTFRPAVVEGEAVPSRARLVVKFVLDE